MVAQFRFLPPTQPFCHFFIFAIYSYFQGRDTFPALGFVVVSDYSGVLSVEVPNPWVLSAWYWIFWSTELCLEAFTQLAPDFEMLLLEDFFYSICLEASSVVLFFFSNFCSMSHTTLAKPLSPKDVMWSLFEVCFLLLNSLRESSFIPASIQRGTPLCLGKISVV